MTDPRTIKQIFERNVELLTHRPARGLLTFATTARLVDGLRYGAKPSNRTRS